MGEQRADNRRRRTIVRLSIVPLRAWLTNALLLNHREAAALQILQRIEHLL